MTYATLSAQASMAFDDYRNGLYGQAIRGMVTPDSVVLDLGAGIGILGLVAAAAGAKRVYLVEPEPVVNGAMAIARANGIADRIVVLEGRIEDLALPEQVDLIISVFTGNLLFSEDLLPSLFHARDRYLKPGGRLIPDRAELCLAPVSAPALHAKHLGRWSQPHAGIDCSPARRFAANEVLWPGRKELIFQHLGQGAALTAVDLTDASHANCDGKIRCAIHTAGDCHGLLGWIRIRLGDQWLSTDPDSPEVHWSPVILPFDPPLPLCEGEDISIALKRPAGGDWTWTAEAGSGSRRHSTFLARLDGARRLKKLAPQYRPGLNPQGKHSLQALALMQQGLCNHDIAQALLATQPEAFPNQEDALALVTKLALRYGE